MLGEIFAGILIVLGSIFILLSVRAYREYRNKTMLFLMFIFCVMLLKALVYIILSLADFTMPIWYYFFMDIVILVTLYFIIVTR